MDKISESLLGMLQSEGVDPSPAGIYEKKPVTRKNLFVHHDSHPYILARVLSGAFGPNWLEWDADALHTTIIAEFGRNIHAQVWGKIRALRALMLTDGFWSNWEIFSRITMPLNNVPVKFEYLQRPTIGQLMVAVDIARLVRPRDESVTEPEFSEEIAKFMASVFLVEGVGYAPEPLEFIQKTIARPQYRCSACGNVGDYDTRYPACERCTGRYDGAKNLNFSATEEGMSRVERGDPILSADLDIFYKNPYDEVMTRYLSSIGLNAESLKLSDMDEIDVQVAKLIVARGYMELRRRQLANQLKVIFDESSEGLYTHG